MNAINNTEELTRRTQQAIEAVRNDRFIMAMRKEVESIVAHNPSPILIFNPIKWRLEPNLELEEKVQFYLKKINERQDAILRAFGIEPANGTFTVPKEAEQFMLDHPMRKK